MKGYPSVRFIEYEFRRCVHCEARCINECSEKIKTGNEFTLPFGCWREDLIKDKPKTEKYNE